MTRGSAMVSAGCVVGSDKSCREICLSNSIFA